MEATKLIDQKLATLTDWRGDMLRSFRKIIHEVDPGIIEEWKWMGSPVWNHNGIICVGNAHKGAVRITFLYGAKLPDPQKVFNAELEGNARRAIKWSEGDKINVAGLKGILRAAMAFNDAKPAARKPDAVTSVSGKRLSEAKGAAKKPAAKAVKAAPARKPVAKAASKKTATKSVMQKNKSR